jgi:hypothetical protein
MGTYVYRITAKQVMCSDGKPANIAVFAYKPYWGIDRHKDNAKMHFRSGATSSDNLADKGKLTGRFVLGDDQGKPYDDSPIYTHSTCRGTFYDDYLGTEHLPKIEGLTLHHV